MANIIGTVITVEKFLQNEEAKVYLPSTPDDGPAIVLEKDRKYIIPDFQREIRWKDENIIELASDISKGDVFLGNIILSKQREKNIILLTDSSALQYCLCF